MPYIIKNGKTYTGNSVSLTQAQYSALSEAEKNNGIAYYIYDSDAVLDASDVGLGEGNVEDLAGSVAVIETSPATATHAVGSYIVWNGQLYSVIDAIDVGQTLTVGSNITATSAGSELTSLKSGLTNLIKTASVTGTTSGTGTLSTKVTHRKVIIAKVESTGLDGIAIPVFTYNETNYFKIFYWDMTPVTNTSVTVTYWYMD